MNDESVNPDGLTVFEQVLAGSRGISADLVAASVLPSSGTHLLWWNMNDEGLIEVAAAGAVVKGQRFVNVIPSVTSLLVSVVDTNGLLPAVAVDIDGGWACTGPASESTMLGAPGEMASDGVVSETVDYLLGVLADTIQPAPVSGVVAAVAHDRHASGAPDGGLCRVDAVHQDVDGRLLIIPLPSVSSSALLNGEHLSFSKGSLPVLATVISWEANDQRCTVAVEPAGGWYVIADINGISATIGSGLEPAVVSLEGDPDGIETGWAEPVYAAINAGVASLAMSVA